MLTDTEIWYTCVVDWIKIRESIVHDVSDLFEMVIESKIRKLVRFDIISQQSQLSPLRSFNSLTFLKLKNNSECFPCLMWSIFIEKMMDVHEDECKVVDFFSSSRRFWCVYKNVDEIQEIDEERMIQLL